MSEHFYWTNYTIELLTPSMCYPHRSLNRSMWIFLCWKQCCKSSSDSLVRSSVAFAFTVSMDSNLVPFNADLVFGNIKVTWSQVRWIRWMFQRDDLVLREKRHYRQGVKRRRVVLMKIPWTVLPHLRSSSSHPFSTVCQNLLVIDRLTFWTSGTQSTWTIPRI